MRLRSDVRKRALRGGVEGVRGQATKTGHLGRRRRGRSACDVGLRARDWAMPIATWLLWHTAHMAADSTERTGNNELADFGNMFIGIAGMIGAGKSTLATALGKHLAIDVYYEPVADNEYLADFYRDTAKYSFAMQVYLLNRRFQQHQEIIWRGRSAVQDRTIYEDSIFAKMLARAGLMDRRDYQTYVQLFKHMSNFMCKPSVIIYLDVSPSSSAERIAMRNRDVEASIRVDYLEALYEGYQEFMHNISKVVPVIRVDYERFATAEEMAEVIKREYLTASFLREVTRFDPTR